MGKKAYYHLQRKTSVQPLPFINNVKIWLFITVVIHSILNKWAIYSNQGKKWYFLKTTLISLTPSNIGNPIYKTKYRWLFGYVCSDGYQMIMCSIRAWHQEYSRFWETCQSLILKTFSLLTLVKLELFIIVSFLIWKQCIASGLRLLYWSYFACCCAFWAEEVYESTAKGHTVVY